MVPEGARDHAVCGSWPVQAVAACGDRHGRGEGGEEERQANGAPTLKVARLVGQGMHASSAGSTNSLPDSARSPP